MTGRVWLCLALAACGYAKPALTGGGGGGGGDDGGAGDARPGSDASGGDAPPDAVPPNAKALLSFHFDGLSNAALSGVDYDGVIDQANGTVVLHFLHVAAGSVTALVPLFTTTGASVAVDGTVETSGTTPHDFTHPVTVRVTARDGSTKDYTVTTAFRDYAPVTELPQAANDIAIGDLDRDGKLDLAAPNATADAVLVNATADGATAPTFSTSVLTTTSANAVVAVFDKMSASLQLGLTDGDAKGEILAVSATAPIAFSTVATMTFGGQQLHAADFDGDGFVDLIAQSATGAAVALNISMEILPGTGLYVFDGFGAAVPFHMCGLSGQSVYNIVVADFNADGKPDLAAACLNGGSGGSVAILLNTTTHAGAPTFAAEQQFVVGNAPTVEAFDLDGDGRADIVTENTPSNTVTVLHNTTASATVVTFDAAQTFPGGTGPFAAASADVDGDGKPDVLVSATGGLAVLLNRTPPGGPLALGKPLTFAMANSKWIVAGDLNGDHVPDVVTAGSTISVLLSK